MAFFSSIKNDSGLVAGDGHDEFKSAVEPETQELHSLWTKRIIQFIFCFDVLGVGAFHKNLLDFFQAFYRLFRKSFHEFITEIMIIFTLLSKSGSIEKNGFGWLNCTHTELRIMRRKQPG